MANAVKTNRSHLIANDLTTQQTRNQIFQIETVLQEITECLTKTTEGFKDRLEVIEEITTDNIADMTTAVNKQIRTIQTTIDNTNKKNEELHKEL
jgi:hypothetical protein